MSEGVDRKQRGTRRRVEAVRERAAVGGMARVEELARVIERLRQSGHTPDAIERVVAQWLSRTVEHRDELPIVLRRLGLIASVRGRHPLIERIDAHIRQPGPGPIATERVPLRKPRFERGPEWFARMTREAAVARYGLPLREAGARDPAAARAARAHATAWEQVQTAGQPHGLGALTPLTRTRIAPALMPGVYALQAKAKAPGSVPAADAARTEARRGLSIPEVLRRLGPGRALPATVRATLGPRLAALGRPVDLAHVLIHDDAAADALCAELGAEAFALGRHVVFAAGRFDPEDGEGMALLAHELTHVWQQAHASVGSGVVRASHFEADADRVAAGVRTALPARAEDHAGGAADVPAGVGEDVAQPCDMEATEPREAEDASREPGDAGREPSAAGDPGEAPRGSDTDTLVTEARAFMRRHRLRPGALFVLADRVTGYDADMRARGSWAISGAVPLDSGYFFDGGIDAEQWCALTPRQHAAITGGRADDLWVVGAQHRRAPEPERDEARDDDEEGEGDDEARVMPEHEREQVRDDVA